MKLDLHRIAFKDTYTIGKLFRDGIFECDTLEDKNRDLNKDGDLTDTGEVKVYGKTCIPFGIYKVILNYSNRFKRIMPLLLDVPNFEGIRIHSGNTEANTSGCILVGQNKVVGQLINSRVTFNLLFTKLQKTKGEIEIEIT